MTDKGLAPLMVFLNQTNITIDKIAKDIKKNSQKKYK